MPDFNIFKDAYRILRQDAGGTVKQEDIGSDPLIIDPHEPDGQTLRLFAGKTCLI
jgi:hypothetical protein